MASTDSDARDSAIGEDEDCSDGVDVLLDLSLNILRVLRILLRTAGVGKTRCVNDANLWKRLCTLITSTKYRYLPLCH